MTTRTLTPMLVMSLLLFTPACGAGRAGSAPAETAESGPRAEGGEPLTTQETADQGITATVDRGGGTPDGSLAIDDYAQQLLGHESDLAAALNALDCDAASNLRDRICDLAGRICRISERHPEAGDVGQRCEDARNRCESARESVGDRC